MTVRNLTKNMRRIKFGKPKSQEFKCEHESIGSVAAGLSIRLNVCFSASSEGEFHDEIEISCEGSKKPYKLQMHAFSPAPDIQFEPLVNFRYIPNGETRYETLVIKNEGRI